MSEPVGAFTIPAMDLGPKADLFAVLSFLEERLITQALEATRGNLSEAARRLGVQRATLHMKAKRLGIDLETYRGNR